MNFILEKVKVEVKNVNMPSAEFLSVTCLVPGTNNAVSKNIKGL
jgi:hypothetical protein